MRQHDRGPHLEPGAEAIQAALARNRGCVEAAVVRLHDQHPQQERRRGRLCEAVPAAQQVGAALLAAVPAQERVQRALRLASGRAAVSHTSASTTPSQPVPSTWTAPWRAAQRRRAAGAWAPRRTCRPSTALLARAHSRQPPVSFTSTQLCTNVPAGYKMRGETEPCH